MKRAFLQLVRLGIGRPGDVLCGSVDWNELLALAERQGLSAVILDGIERLPDTQWPPKELLLQWIGETLQSYEYRYEQHQRAIAELTGFYREHGLKMMVLKGYACSLDWPKPEHRPCGDIDIWQFGKQKDGDSLLETEKGIKVDKSHHHHTVFYWRDFMVENHYDFINVYAHKSNAELEKIFKELGMDDSHYVEVMSTSTGSATKVYIPSPNLHALFLVKHMASHFAASEISLRQVLDWAFFVEKHTKEIDWNWLLELLESFHMKEFFNLINAICVDDLGFSATLFPNVQYLPDIKERVLNDIISPEFTAVEPKGFLPRVIYKYRRWKANGWKHKLCYKESMWSAFWSGVWNHLLKPASI